jgi:hypothetical protein
MDGCQHIWGFDGAVVKCGFCGAIREDVEAEAAAQSDGDVRA